MHDLWRNWTHIGKDAMQGRQGVQTEGLFEAEEEGGHRIDGESELCEL
jgi:hypothetical protein